MNDVVEQSIRSSAKANAADVLIRPVTDGDADAVWEIFQDVISTGDTYTYRPDTTRAEAEDMFRRDPRTRFVVEYQGKVCGYYDLKPNIRGLGSHVANCGYMIHSSFQNRGIGLIMAQHSLDEAKRMGFRAMQFNFVVSTNTRAVSRWRLLGFNIIGVIPKAFQHHTHGLVDAYIMYRVL